MKIAAEAKRRIKAALDYAHYAHVVPVRTSSQVQTLVNDKEMDLSSHLSAMRNQIHVRLYVYGVKKADLPLIGSDGGEAEQTRLKEALVNLITTESPLPMTPPPAPDPYLLRALHRTPTKLALRLDHDYIAQIASVITQYKALVENGTFSLPRNRTHRPLVDDDSGNESDDGDTRQPATVPVPPRYANVAKPGTRFDEDDTTWQVLSMEFSEEYDQLLCYYFDVELAKKKNITVKDMKLAIEKDPPQELEPLERSKLSEVCKWIKEHREREM